MPITILELAEYRLDREATNGGDYEQAGLSILGGCAVCHATLAAYNGYPSKGGFWLCADDVGDAGWDTVEQANEDIFVWMGDEEHEPDLPKLRALLQNPSVFDDAKTGGQLRLPRIGQFVNLHNGMLLQMRGVVVGYTVVGQEPKLVVELDQGSYLADNGSVFVRHLVVDPDNLEVVQ